MPKDVKPHASQRIVVIDMVRGFAVLGIVAMNIIGFALPFDAYLDPRVAGVGNRADLWAWALGAIVFDGKMRALFAMLFGTSMLLMADRGPHSGVARRHMARMLVLLLIGVAHGWFLWWGDILTSYALLGMGLFWLRHLDAHRLFGLAMALLVLPAALSFVAAVLPGEGGAGRGAAALAAEIAATRGNWAEVQTLRASQTLHIWTASLTALPGGPLAETTGLILLGMGLYRAGWWGDSVDNCRRQRQILAATVPALLVTICLTCHYAASGFQLSALYLMEGGRILTGPLIATAYTVFLIHAVNVVRLSWLTQRLAAAGRMALSNYLATSLVMTFLFYGYGFGLFGRIGRTGLWLPVGFMWLAMLWWSKPWLDHFAFGPCEWLWRSLARWKIQPLVRDRGSRAENGR